MNKLLGILGFVVLMSFILIPAQLALAEEITFHVEIEITDVMDDDNLLGGTVVPGDTIIGHYTFDSDFPDINTDLDTLGGYRFDNLHFEFGSFSFSSDIQAGSDLMIYTNEVGSDSYIFQDITFQQLSGPTLPGPTEQFRFDLRDTDGTVFSDDSLQTTPPPLDEFEVNFFRFAATTGEIFPSLPDDEQVRINGIVTSLTLPPVVGGELLPIDTTALLLAGAQTFSWMIPVILSVIGIALFVVSRKSENS